MNEILLFSEKPLPRLQYVAAEIFERRLACRLLCTHSREEYLQSSFPKVQYGNARLDSKGLLIPDCGLLAEQSIRKLEIDVSREALPGFFRHPVPDADFVFDLFSMVFYLLSRYEEYLPFTPDVHGRFSASQSMAYRNGFLNQPLADQWCRALATQLTKRYPGLQIPVPSWTFQPTFDIDMAWAYSHKGIRGMGGLLKELMRGDWKQAEKRISVWMGREKDPYDTFSYLSQIHGQSGALAVIYFFLLGKRGPFDKNISPQSTAFRKLVRRTSEQYSCGIHPSYGSNASLQTLEKELNTMAGITGTRPYRSRQHFLKLRFPDTYRNLLQVGICEDYSMGYADDTGFRAGTAFPFSWYDLSTETATDLLIHPFQIMDVTLKNYLNLSPEAAVARCSQLLAEVKKTGGALTSLWHNSSFAPLEGWEGWEQVYEALLKMGRQEG